VTAWLLQRVAGTGLTPGALKVTAAVLRSVPLPTDEAAWAAGTAAFRASVPDRAARKMALIAPAETPVTIWKCRWGKCFAIPFSKPAW